MLLGPPYPRGCSSLMPVMYRKIKPGWNTGMKNAFTVRMNCYFWEIPNMYLLVFYHSSNQFLYIALIRYHGWKRSLMEIIKTRFFWLCNALKCGRCCASQPEARGNDGPFVHYLPRELEKESRTMSV